LWACGPARLCGPGPSWTILCMSKVELDWKHGRLPRLPGHDYAGGGGYFITINTFQRAPIFGSHAPQGVVLSKCGRIAQEEWLRGQIIRPELVLDVFVVMPDHIHAILFLPGDRRGRRSQFPSTGASNPLYRPPRSLGSLIAGFKSSTARRINLLRVTPSAAVWQSNYHDHIIRTDRELARIREYILRNPLRRR
jgi:putative transposase